MPTVNVYVSYCPQDLGSGLRLAGNFSADEEMAQGQTIVDPDDPSYNISSPYANGDTPDANRYALSGLAIADKNGNYLNSTSATNGSFSLDSPTCHICPEDSGICCPPFTDCGSDGHCPFTALENCGYARFGVNLVAQANSSASLGMGALGDGVEMSRLRAPGLPGSKKGGDASGDGESIAERVRRRFLGGHAGFGRGVRHEHGQAVERRAGQNHVHGHAH